MKYGLVFSVVEQNQDDVIQGDERQMHQDIAYRRSFCFLLLLVATVGCQTDHGLKPTEPEAENEKGSISGTVFFEGSWPDSTEEVRVAVYAGFPTEQMDFYMGAYSDSLHRWVHQCDYSVELSPGTYELIMVVLRKQGEFWSPDCFAGMYYSPSDSTHHGVVALEKGQNLVDIDISVDLSGVGVLPPELEDVFKQ